MIPKPIRHIKDFRVGVLYFEVGVDREDRMFLFESYIPYGKPFTVVLDDKKERFIKVKMYIGNRGPYKDILSFKDAGIIKCPPEKDNLHRTFRFTKRSFAFFKNIVRYQALKRYKKIITAFN
jgi:hypothetical protein